MPNKRALYALPMYTCFDIVKRQAVITALNSRFDHTIYIYICLPGYINLV